MNTTSAFLTRLIAAALVLAGPSAVPADTNVTTAWGTNAHIDGANCNSPYNALQLNATRAPSDGSPPFLGNLLVLSSFPKPSDNVVYTHAFFNCWESTTWTSNSNLRRAAKVNGAYLNEDATSVDDLYLPVDRSITLRDLAIRNVDLSTDNVDFDFRPITGDSSLTFNNGSLILLNSPGFYEPAHFTLTASGESKLGGWRQSRVASQTTLNVTAGARLTLFRLGSNHSAQTWDALYFDRLGNRATIDGGTLRLQESFVTFGRPTAATDADYGQMTFKNNARLEVTGESAKLESGFIDFINSTLTLGSANKVKADAILTLDGAGVDIDEAGRLDAPVLEVRGNTTITLPKEYGVGAYPVTTGVMVMDRDTSLTLNGEGSLAVTVQLLYTPAGAGHQIGRIVINDNAQLTSTGSIFTIVPGASITINRTSADVSGAMAATDGGVIYLEANPSVTGRVTNHGRIDISDGALGAIGPVTIQGGSEGYVLFGEAGVLTVGNFGSSAAASASLTTNNQVELGNFSTLQLTLDPTARTNGQLRLGSTLDIEHFADLNLAVVNDVALLPGTKFALIDYGVFASARPRFNGYPEGSTLVLGLNRYQINYADRDPNWHNSPAITLTVVPAAPPSASLTPATQTLTGTVGVDLTPSAPLTPSGFGGVVTYSVNPSLPAGLKLDVVTGVISGFPSEALTVTTFTIRGVGSVSGSATVTVDLTIAAGSQTIAFGSAPNPTYAPGGGFLVSASATSGLPVTFSSLTPAVCTTAGSSSVFMLGAGTCTIAADQAGNANYGAAPQVTQTITIAKAPPAPLTLFATPPNISVSDGTGTSTLSTSGGSGTSPIVYAVVSGPCALEGVDTLRGTGPGTCIVKATQAADGNYTAGQSNPVNIQVGTGAQDQLVLKATPTSFNVNGTSALSTTGGSGSGAVTYAVASGPCTMSGLTTVKGTAAGECQVIATKAGDGSYGAATSNSLTLTVKRLIPAALVLTATPTSIGFGGTSTLSTIGGIPGATVSYLVTGPCYVDGDSLLGTSSGACQVTASQAATGSYEAATSNTVTVTVAERTTIFSYPPATVSLGRPVSLRPITAGFTNPTFALLYGDLPAGLTLNAQTGVISGIPTGPLGAADAVISVFENNAYDAALAVFTVQAAPKPTPALSEYGLAIAVLLLSLVSRRALRRAPRR